MWTLTFLILLSIALGAGAWLFFIWSVKTGHYDDIERPKHRMMDDDDQPSPPIAHSSEDVSPAKEGTDSRPGPVS